MTPDPVEVLTAAVAAPWNGRIMSRTDSTHAVLVLLDPRIRVALMEALGAKRAETSEGRVALTLATWVSRSTDGGRSSDNR